MPTLVKSTLLKPLYKKAINGLPILGTPLEVAQKHAASPEPLNAVADQIINHYTRLGGATGFVSGLPGFLLLPITLPANLAGTALLQLHMAATLAVLGGRDLQDPATREQCIDCLLEKINEKRKNTEETEVITRTGVKLAEKAVRFAAGQSVKLAGKAARSMVLRRLGGRMPLLGGVIGAGSDAYVTRHVGRCAKETFLTP